MDIMKAAKKNGGALDEEYGINKIRSGPYDEKRKKQMLMWHRINIDTLTNANYLVKSGDGGLKVNPLLLNNTKEFTPSANHLKLLQNNREGVIKISDLRMSIKAVRQKEADRQKKMQDGMVKNLHRAGYLERTAVGEYRLTGMAKELLNKTHPHKLRAKKETPDTFRVTTFDRHISEVCIGDMIDKDKLAAHEKCGSIGKRILALEKNGLIKDGGLTPEFKFKLENSLKSYKELTLDSLSGSQISLIKDLRTFQSITADQLLKFVYDGKDPVKAFSDIDFLVKKKVIKLDDNFNIFVLDAEGVKLTNALFPDSVKYKTKLHSRAEELKHDMLVYSAYNEWLRNISEKGAKVIEIKNDRQMRKEDATNFGHMQGAYPDLRVLYKLPNNKNTLQYDLEADNGYREQSLMKKLSGITGGHSLKSHSMNTSGGNTGGYYNGGKGGNYQGGGSGKSLGWYCNNALQATKVIKAIKRSKDTKKINRARDIDVFYFDKDMNLHYIK